MTLTGYFFLFLLNFAVEGQSLKGSIRTLNNLQFYLFFVYGTSLDHVNPPYIDDWLVLLQTLRALR